MTEKTIPLRLYTMEVLALVGVSRTTWKKMQKDGKAPLPAYRGKGGQVYLGKDISVFMGLTEYENNADHDPFLEGVKKLGRDKTKATALLRHQAA